MTEDGRLWLSEEEPPAPQSTSSMFTPLLQLVRLSFLTLHTHTHRKQFLFIYLLMAASMQRTGVSKCTCKIYQGNPTTHTHTQERLLHNRSSSSETLEVFSFQIC